MLKVALILFSMLQKKYFSKRNSVKGDELNSNALSNVIANFFHIFVIALLVECEKNGCLCLTEGCR